MFVPILLFAVGLFLLIKGGDIFVESAVGITRRFGLSELLVGATVVSLGTTLPEVTVSVISSLNGHGGLSYGNAIGSVICNTALISAISIVFRPNNVDTRSLKRPVLFFFIAAMFYSFNAYAFGTFSRASGFILLGIFCLYTFSTVLSCKKMGSDFETDVSLKNKNNSVLIKDFIFLIIGSFLVYLGSKLTVDNGIVIAEKIGVPESVIALTFVALGTSLPEFVTAVTSLIKGHGALSLGNIIGANLFNIVLVSGLSITLSPFDLPLGNQIFGKSSSLVVDIPLMLTVMLILTLPIMAKKKTSRLQGFILLILYSAFCALQFFM